MNRGRHPFDGRRNSCSSLNPPGETATQLTILKFEMDALLLPTFFCICTHELLFWSTVLLCKPSEGVNAEELMLHWWKLFNGSWPKNFFKREKGGGGGPILSLDCRFVENLPPPIFFYNQKNNTSFIRPRRRRRPVVFIKKERNGGSTHTHVCLQFFETPGSSSSIHTHFAYNPFHYCSSSSISSSFIISYA